MYTCGCLVDLFLSYLLAGFWHYTFSGLKVDLLGCVFQLICDFCLWMYSWPVLMYVSDMIVVDPLGYVFLLIWDVLFMEVCLTCCVFQTCSWPVGMCFCWSGMFCLLTCSWPIGMCVSADLGCFIYECIVDLLLCFRHVVDLFECFSWLPNSRGWVQWSCTPTSTGWLCAQRSGDCWTLCPMWSTLPTPYALALSSTSSTSPTTSAGSSSCGLTRSDLLPSLLMASVPCLKGCLYRSS